MEDSLKNIGMRVQEDKAETGAVFNFLLCGRIMGKSAEGFPPLKFRISQIAKKKVFQKKEAIHGLEGGFRNRDRLQGMI